MFRQDLSWTLQVLMGRMYIKLIPCEQATRPAGNEISVAAPLPMVRSSSFTLPVLGPALLSQPITEFPCFQFSRVTWCAEWIVWGRIICEPLCEP